MACSVCVVSGCVLRLIEMCDAALLMMVINLSRFVCVSLLFCNRSESIKSPPISHCRSTFCASTFDMTVKLTAFAHHRSNSSHGEIGLTDYDSCTSQINRDNNDIPQSRYRSIGAPFALTHFSFFSSSTTNSLYCQSSSRCPITVLLAAKPMRT